MTLLLATLDMTAEETSSKPPLETMVPVAVPMSMSCPPLSTTSFTP
jgi:hypothetical protein